MGLGSFIKKAGRIVAKPFEEAGQGVKHFFTGPEYDKMAEQMVGAPEGQYGSSAPTGPVGATGGNNSFSPPNPYTPMSTNQYGPQGTGALGPTFPRNPYGGGINSSDGGGGMSSYEKWLLALQIGGGALSAWSNLQNQKDAREQSEANREEQQRQFNMSGAPGIAKQLETAPLRDRASYLLQARMGLNPQPFEGATLTQPGQMGGVSQGMEAANKAYTPGAGNTGSSTDLYKQMLQQMGYTYGGR